MATISPVLKRAFGATLGSGRSRNTFGFPVREDLYPSEKMFYTARRDVAGMFNKETNDITINPFTTGINKRAVERLEGFRGGMDDRNIVPNFNLTQKQKNFLDKFATEEADFRDSGKFAKQTIASRILVGDKSAQNVTLKQIEETNRIQRMLEFPLLSEKEKQANDVKGLRRDGSRKGKKGFLGNLPRLDNPNSFSNEISIEIDIDGELLLIPSLVPTLTKDEINHLLSGGEPTDEILNKAVEHARGRLKQGLSPFAD